MDEDTDAKVTQLAIKGVGRDCLLIKGDMKDVEYCKEAVQRTLEKFGKINIVVNNAAIQFSVEYFEDIRIENLHTTFETNIYS